MTSETKQTVNVYTLPVCPNCSVLKKSLMEHGISFRGTRFGLAAVADDPAHERGLYNGRAVLQVRDTFLTFDDLFHNDELDIDLILSLMPVLETRLGAFVLG